MLKPLLLPYDGELEGIRDLSCRTQKSCNKPSVLSSLEAYTGDFERQQRQDEPRWPPHGTYIESGCSSSWNRPCRLDSRMDRAPSPIIHEVLPSDVLAMIFEEHAKYEWSAPAIDERVCRLWRQIVLDTPRAWRYLEISPHERRQPSIRGLKSWLSRSCAVPLHIRVGIDIELDKSINGRTLYGLVSDCHTRIASLRMVSGYSAFFEGRVFPCLRLLDITNWCLSHGYSPTIHFCSFPELRSLRLCHIDGSISEDPLRQRMSMVALNNLTSMESLVLYLTTCTSLAQHSLSLTTLMLDDVTFGDPMSSPVGFPSLTYLSLYEVRGLKPHIHAPCLETYHEGADTMHESFSTPLPSLVEYGLYGPNSSDSDPAKWHKFFPNISRVAIRAVPSVLIPLLDSLSTHLPTLLALHTISVGTVTVDTQFTEGEQETMKSLIGVRGDKCNMGVALHFEEEPSFQIPIFFGAVSRRIIR